MDISNVMLDGTLAPAGHKKLAGALANQLWHSDSSFQYVPGKYSMLSAVILPQPSMMDAGETEFADMRAGYDALSDAMKEKLEPLVAEHFALYSRIWLGDEDWTAEQKAGMPPVRWRVVRTRPYGRKSLFIGAHANQIIGWPVPEGRMFLLDLLEHATQRQFVYRHEWQVGDLVIWDNRATLHRGRPYDMSQRAAGCAAPRPKTSPRCRSRWPRNNRKAVVWTAGVPPALSGCRMGFAVLNPSYLLQRLLQEHADAVVGVATERAAVVIAVAAIEPQRGVVEVAGLELDGPHALLPRGGLGGLQQREADALAARLLRHETALQIALVGAGAAERQAAERAPVATGVEEAHIVGEQRRQIDLPAVLRRVEGDRELVGLAQQLDRFALVGALLGDGERGFAHSADCCNGRTDSAILRS